MRPLVLTSLLLLVLPQATASEDAFVEITHESGDPTCDDGIAACVVEIEADPAKPGDAEIDASQEVDRIEVVVHDEETPISSVVPEEGVQADASNAYVEHAVFVMVAETWQSSWKSPSTDFDFAMDSRGYHLEYVGVKPTENRYDPHPQKYSILYNDKNVRYRHLGPFNDLGGNHSDAYIEQSRWLCKYEPAGECRDAYQAVEEGVESHLPQVHIGFRVQRVALGTMPELDSSRHENHASVLARSRHPGDAPEGRALTREQATPRTPDDYAAPPEEPPPGDLDDPKRHDLESSSTSLGTRPQDSKLWKAMGTALFVSLLLALGLYARLRRKSDILLSEVRREMLSHVLASPGIRLAELSQAFAISRTTTEHHIRVLNRAGLLKSVRMRGQIRIYPTGVPATELDVFLRHPNYGTVLQALRENPQGLTRAELKARLNDAPIRTRNHVLRRLLDEGILHRAPDTTEERYVLGPTLGRAAGD